MSLTYVKGLPTPIEELNAIGQTNFSMFLYDYSSVFYRAACDTVNYLLLFKSFNKSAWNTHLQQSYGINKRQANGVISSAKGRVTSAVECRKEHIKTLNNKLKSASKWLKGATKKLNSCQKFYARKNWKNSKTSTLLPLSCSLRSKNTNYQNLKFQVHHKKRRIYELTQQIEHLRNKPTRVKVPRWDCFVVGSKDETLGNQVCQWSGNNLKFRVPYCLENKYGKNVVTKLGNFKRNINRIPERSARSWHFYIKEGKWKVALQFTPAEVVKVSKPVNYGCIGIDLNPGSVDWAYVDWDGNLKHHGKFVLQQGLPRGKQQAQLVRVSLKLAELAIKYKCPIVCEELNFSRKKAQLREANRKIARMLSGWAYSEFFKQLSSILGNRGIQLKTVNPAFTSLIGLVKYVKQYGLSSGVAAGIAIARRGMGLTEKLPDSITAYLDVKSRKHGMRTSPLRSLWLQLNKLIKSCSVVKSRHSYYSISNWEFLVTEQ
ncbi:MAG: hypothetical protein AAF383_08720 [Cyanobacteria bacterium P01_A01_bin.83]